MKTRRLDRISDQVKEEIRHYLAEKRKLKQNDHNLQKIETFEKIRNNIEQNTLSVESLMEILGNLDLTETQNLFHKGGISSGPSADSNAAILITKLFSEFGHKLARMDLKDIVIGKICSNNMEKAPVSKEIKDDALKSMVRRWQENHYHEQRRNHLDHELKARVFPDIKEAVKDESSLAQTLHEKYQNLNESNSGRFIADLCELQKHCPQYMSELLSELRLHYAEPDEYRGYLAAIIKMFSSTERSEPLCKSVLDSHHEFLTDIVSITPHIMPKIFFALDSVMQARVHQNLLLDARWSEKDDARNKIYEMALNEIEVQPGKESRQKKRTIVKASTSSSDDVAEPSEPEVHDIETIAKPFSKKELINAIYSAISKNGEEIIEERIKNKSIEKINAYLAIRQWDKAKRGIVEQLFNAINESGKLTREMLQGFITAICKNNKLRKKVFSTKFWHSEEDSSFALFFADLYHIVTGRKLKRNERKKMVNGEFPEEAHKRKESLPLEEKIMSAKKNAEKSVDHFVDSLDKKIDLNQCDLEEIRKIQVANAISDTASDVIINKYLGTTDYSNDHTSKSNPTKIGFFSKLANKISKNGFTAATIADFLSEEFPWLSGRKKLFARKYIGKIEKSGAANTLANLYGEASGKEMTSEEILTMVWTGNFPEDNLLKREIEQFVENPSKTISRAKTPEARLMRGIAHEYKKLQDVKAVLQREKFARKHVQDAVYQQSLIERGIAKATNPETRDQIRFDLQGHVILDLPVKENSVFCSLDIKKNGALETAFMDFMLSDVDGANKSGTLPRAINALLNLPSRSSIIPLQEEMEMRMRYVSRLMEESQPGLDWDQIRNEAALAINQAVKQEFQKILLMEEVYRDNQINTVALNRKLDEARTELTSSIQQTLNEAVRGKSPVEHSRSRGLDYLRTDVDNQAVVRISATEESKTRIIQQSVYADGIVKPSDKATLELNVPSMDIKELSHDDAVEKIAAKLHEHHDFFAQQGHEGPMIFNLPISLHSKLEDISVDRENRQRKIAARMLKGAHLFNQEQVFAGRAKNLVYVQNIDVSQHGDKDIEYSSLSFNHAISEAALMSEMAMLSCFASHAALLLPKLRNRVLDVYQGVHGRYVDFLRADLLRRVQKQQGNIYFESDTERGHRVHLMIDDFKRYLYQDPNAFNTDHRAPLSELALKTLMKLMSMNKHLKPRYGSLVQSLSVFIEQASQTGSEGMNGRDEMIMKRVDLLHVVDHLHQAGADPEDKRLNIISALLTFLNNNDRNSQDLKDIIQALNEVLNDYNVYGASVNLGHVARGASNDVEASEPDKILFMEFNTAKLGKLGFFDRKLRVAEPKELSNLQQKHAEQAPISIEAINMRPTI